MREFFSEYRMLDLQSVEQAFPSGADEFTRIALLAQTMIDDRLKLIGRNELSRLVHTGGERSPCNVRLRELQKLICDLGLDDAPSLESLPRGSFTVSFRFELAKPYLSRDDAAFYPEENPLKKDKVFKLPLVSPQNWKGNLWYAAYQANLDRNRRTTDNEAVLRLFGNDKDERTDFRAGRLRFFPTFFDRMDLEVINPHDRRRRVGKNPIKFECVPPGARGRFHLLYLARPSGGPEACDLALVCRLVTSMMTVYGFSAKKTSGCGIARRMLPEPGEIQIHLKDCAARTFSSFKGLEEAGDGLARLAKGAADA